MIAFAYYLLKVIICSGLMLLYYHLALRNKLFHQWNRFYLLATIVLSLIIPCVKFNVWTGTEENNISHIQLLQVVYSADEYVAEINSGKADLSMEQWVAIAYSAASVIVLVLFILALLRIRSIIRSHSILLIDDIKFVNTEEKDSPFSFFNYIFWNKQIELNSPSGEYIFQHELVHVREKHSFDKIFLQLILIGFWCNPFFWLIRKELKMIHEFLADEKSVGQSDAKAFAAMILQATYPKHYTYLTNQFFQSTIKRRLTMLTKTHNSKISYISRILALPLFALIIFAFTIKVKPVEKRSMQALEKEITVVIDAGHGGGTGARAGNFYEDDLVLELAKTIKELNNNDKINILLTREDEQNVGLKERVEFARRNNADLFISVHINAIPENLSANIRSNGFEVCVSNKAPSYQKQSELFGAALVQELSKSYNTFSNLVKRQVGVWVLDQNICPSVLIECGYLTDKNDRDFIIKKENQKLIAEKILHAIEAYAISPNSTGKASSKYNVQEQNLLDTSKPVRITLNTETLEDPVDQNFLIIIDGVEKGRAKDVKVEKIVPAEQIEKIDVFKGDAAIKKFGAKGKQGVVVIITKKNNEKGQTKNPETALTIRNSSQNNNGNTIEEVEIKNTQSVTNIDNKALLVIDGVEKGTVQGLSQFVNAQQIIEVNVLKGIEATNKYGKKGVNGVVELSTTNQINTSNEVSISETNQVNTINENITVETLSKPSHHFKSERVNIDQARKSKENALVFVDGKEIGRINDIQIDNIVNPNIIIEVSIYKSPEAVKKYGNKGSNGVIEIKTNKK